VLTTGPGKNEETLGFTFTVGL